jgi:2-aminoadipate transaminase
MTATAPAIDFTRGVPAVESFPLAQVAECAAAAVGGPQGARVLQYGKGLGFGPLREWLADRHGLRPDQVLLANGSLQIVEFLALALLAPGDPVFVESPTYDRTLTLLRRRGAAVTGIPLTGDGPDLDALEAALARQVPTFFYTIPDFQNPSGVTATRAGRERLAALAERHGFWLVEDAPYRPLRYRGEPLPTLFELAPARTLQLSSFTKQIGPGLRVGSIVGDAAILARLAAVAEDTYITPNTLGAATAYEFCRRGWLEPQLARLRALYGPRLVATGAALRRHLPAARWVEPDGGFFLSLTLPEGTTAETTRARAAERGVELSDGRGFFPDPADGARFLRLPFCALTPEEIETGVRRLAQAVG